MHYVALSRAWSAVLSNQSLHHDHVCETKSVRERICARINTYRFMDRLDILPLQTQNVISRYMSRLIMSILNRCGAAAKRKGVSVSARCPAASAEIYRIPRRAACSNSNRIADRYYAHACRSTLSILPAAKPRFAASKQARP